MNKEETVTTQTEHPYSQFIANRMLHYHIQKKGAGSLG
jgi:hypothetical protein